MVCLLTAGDLMVSDNFCLALTFFFKKYMFSLWMEKLEVDWRQNWRNS
jgi:hypothetical protein